MIKIVNLVNGEQIIGEVDSDCSEFYNIHEPYYIVDAMDDAGNSGTKLINVLTFSDNNYIVVNTNKVVFDMPASAHMSAYYNKVVKAMKKNSSTKKMIDDAMKQIDEMDEYMKNYAANVIIGKQSVH